MILGLATIAPEPSQLDEPLRHVRDNQKSVRVIVFTFFLVTVLSAILFVVNFGHPLPVEDEFVYTRFLVQDTFPDLSQLWSQHNEHRIPTARLLYHLIAVGSSADSRFGMLFSVLLLSSGAYLTMRAAAELRGHVAIWDALLPVLFLHMGHQDTLLNAFQICFALYAFWMGALLYGMAVSPQNYRVSLMICGVALWGMILTCSAGVIVAVMCIPWLLLMTYVRWRTVAARSFNEDVRLGVLTTLSVLIVLALYLYGLKTKKYPRNTDPLSVLETAQYFLSSAMGAGAVRYHSLVAGLLAGTFLLVAVNFIRNWKFERAKLAIVGWIFICVAILTLALILGYTRGSLGGLPRYSILGAPIVAILLILSNLQQSKWVRVSHGMIVAALLVAMPFNVIEGLQFGRGRRAMYERVMADYQRGAGFETIATYYDSNQTIDPDTIAKSLEGLQQRRLSAFTDEPFVQQPPRKP